MTFAPPRCCINVLVAFLGISVPAIVHAAQTDNRGMQAVPVPGAITIDGKLDDWDLSGAVLMCYDIETLKEVYAANVALMYDAENLYLSIHWADTTPMGNSHSPLYQADRGWAGDCVQLRLKTDKITHISAWYYAAEKQPALLLDFGKGLNEPFGGGSKQLMHTTGWKMTEGAEQAFVKDEDGKGYVQELKLPWKQIADKSYKAGDQFSCGFELLYGEVDWPVHRYADNLSEGASSREFFFTNTKLWGSVTLSPQGKLNLPTPSYLKALEAHTAEGPVAISYELPEDARVTIAIDNASGKRVRNLIPALPRKKGKNTEKWDGLDDEGKPAPVGDYSYKAIYHQPIHVNWVMSFANPGSPPWSTSDDHGAFYADHTPAHAAAAGGDFVALGCPIGEAGKHLIGLDLTGQRVWGLANRAGHIAGRLSLATDGKLLWVGQDRSGTIYRADIATGKYAAWNAKGKDANGDDFAILDFPIFDAAAQKERNAPVNLTAIAVREDVLAICLARSNKVQFRSSDTGALLREVEIDSPRAAGFEPDGSLVVLSKERLIRIAADGKVTPVGAANLEDAFGIAVDSKGSIYVSVRGKSQNVQVFDHAGKLIRQIGKVGGRPDNGPFDDNGMLEPAGIAVDSKGRLWVTEETTNPKRTSLWNAADGTLVKDFIGSTAYAAAGSINPYDPTMAFSDSTVYKINLATGEWRPTYSIGQTGHPDEHFAPSITLHSVVRVLNGRQYVYTAGLSRVQCMTFRDGRWRSVAAMGIVSGKDNNRFQDAWIPKMEGHNGEVFAWSDLNGDGLTQPDEVTLSGGSGDKNQPAAQGIYWGFLPDNEGVLTLLSKPSGGMLRYAITGWRSEGAPIYDAAKPTVAKVDFTGLGQDIGSLMGGKDGRVYINQQPLMAVAADGKVLWTYPSNHVSVHGSHRATAARPGYVIGPIAIAGTADLGGDIGEVFDMNGNLGEHYLFTADGLYIQAIFKDTRGLFETPEKAVRGMPVDAATSGGEDFGANFVRTSDGKIYLTNGSTDARIHEVGGLDTIKRFNGKFNYSTDQYAQAQTQAQAAAAKSTLARSYTIEKVDAPVAIDGKATAWPELADENNKTAIEIREGERTVYARVAARYDADHLYLAYRVKAQTGRMRNVGQEDELLFKTGDCVDLMLRPESDPSQNGGIRLLISTMGGKPTAVLYEKTVPGTAPESRVPFSSPSRTIYFDRVRRVQDLKIETAPASGGYVVEVAVPWSVLGIQPKAGLALKGDVGVLFADNGGTTTIARQYWSNKATGLVNDIPGEADLTPGLWGSFILK